jgi:hypothetical protein
MVLTESFKKLKNNSNLLNTKTKNSKNNSDLVPGIELSKLLSITLKLPKDMSNKFKTSEMKSNLYAKDNRTIASKPKIFKEKKTKPTVF